MTELTRQLGVTNGGTSVALRVLEQLGMVRRGARPGDRHAYFEAEPSFRPIGRRVLERRHEPAFERSFDLVRAARARLEAAATGAGALPGLERLRALEGSYLVRIVVRLDLGGGRPHRAAP